MEVRVVLMDEGTNPLTSTTEINVYILTHTVNQRRRVHFNHDHNLSLNLTKLFGLCNTHHILTTLWFPLNLMFP